MIIELAVEAVILAFERTSPNTPFSVVQPTIVDTKLSKQIPSAPSQPLFVSRGHVGLGS
jgi:hypothetical protein